MDQPMERLLHEAFAGSDPCGLEEFRLHQPRDSLPA